MPITQIEIRNVKGIGHGVFAHTIIPNKPSILVAPNGFGKSSIATAFKSLKENRLALDSDDLYEHKAANLPLLSIAYSGPGGVTTATADSGTNAINGAFDCFVINNQVKAKAVRLPGHVAPNAATASLHIDEVVLVPNIPDVASFGYGYNDEKTAFGQNGKLLPNITERFTNEAFIAVLANSYELFEKLQRVKDSRIITQAKEAINARGGTAAEVRTLAEVNVLPGLEMLVPLRELADRLQPLLGGAVRLDHFLTAMQVERLYRHNRTVFKSAVKRALYVVEKEGYIQSFKAFNNTWRDIKPKEKDRSLVVEFPKAHYISNGQRDVLSFVALLEQARRRLRGARNILIIDEIFDYLDDANLTVAQYYITEFIKAFKAANKEIYPLILTHLDPRYFKNFAFSDLKIYYLDRRTASVNQDLRHLVRVRDDAATPGAVKDDIAKYLLHFHTGQINRRADFTALHLPPDWGEANHFETFIGVHMSRYLNNQPNWDPYAVCCGVRREVERKAYQSIPAAADQAAFLQTNYTRKKLEFALNSVDVPEYYFLLGIVYNDGLHWKNNFDNDSPIIIKLGNATIRSLVAAVFA